MPKTVLILVLSCDIPPYDSLMRTQMQTWDSIDVPGTETIYYCAGNPTLNTGCVIYMPVKESLLTMGHKTLMAFEWALRNKKFDYLARVHSSTYVDKNRLIEYVQTLPDIGVFAGAVAQSVHGYSYTWGGAHMMMSRDVLQKIVDNKDKWDHTIMEDNSMSLVVSGLGIPFMEGKSGSIDKMEEGWRCISYGGESISFTDFSEIKRLGHHYYRVKQDGARWGDELIMKELFKVLNT